MGFSEFQGGGGGGGGGGAGVRVLPAQSGLYDYGQRGRRGLGRNAYDSQFRLEESTLCVSVYVSKEPPPPPPQTCSATPHAPLAFENRKSWNSPHWKLNRLVNLGNAVKPARDFAGLGTGNRQLLVCKRAVVVMVIIVTKTCTQKQRGFVCCAWFSFGCWSRALGLF